MRCPDLVGRAGQAETLTRRLDDLAAGLGGGFVVLLGDAGLGKSRLLRLLAEAAGAHGLIVLSGRSSAGGSASPYRPMRDALLGAVRSQPIPASPSLQGFEGHLSRLLPSGAIPAVEDSPLLVAEAAVRLLAVLATGKGCLLCLEDIHWADPETIAVVDYLTDALDDQPILCVCTSRRNGAAEGVINRLQRDRADLVVEFEPLEDADVVEMVSACLGMPQPPPGVGEFVVVHSDGNPLLVEELLAGLVAHGQLRHDCGSWEPTGPLTPSVPASLKASIDRRLASLDPTERRVLGAAALLGRQFDWNLLPGIAEVDGRAAADALRAAVAEQLIEVDGDGFVFRHALTREIVLADVLPPERRELALRAWPAIELAHPGLPGPSCELAAQLAEAAGELGAAADRLIVSARRAYQNGALATAEATARRASDLARAVDEDLAGEAEELLVHVLGAAGKPTDALALGRCLADRLERAGADSVRRVELLLAIARAALAAGDLEAAREMVGEARRIAGPNAKAVVRAQMDAVAGELALDRSDLEEAEAITRRSVEGARATQQPAVLCEALLTLGRILRVKDVGTTQSCFAESAAVASEAGLSRWHLRAQQELALEEWIERGAPPMEETRALAARYGAHITAAVMDLGLADLYLSSFDRLACMKHAKACADASRRFGLATEPVANLWLAGAYALAGDDPAMQVAIDVSLGRDPDDPRLLADLYGRVLVTRAVVRDELAMLPSLTETMMKHVARAPQATSVYPGRVLWALLRTMHDDDCGHRARLVFRSVVDRHRLPMFLYGAEIIEAVALGRMGHGTDAATRAERAHKALSGQPHGAGQTNVVAILAAQAAIRDGWGSPVPWLRQAEAFFTEHGFDRTARRCRALLTEAGAPVPRRRGQTEVPEALRALGVTGREVDVLKLIVAGHTNKEIAAELVLSPKTVERHLSNLFGRLGVTDRHTLADAGRPHLS